MLTRELATGRYRPIRSLGRGGMAHVWLADDLLLHRPVAVKELLRSDGSARHAEVHARILREARLAASLTHPNAVGVYDLIVEDGRPHVIMEFVQGESLESLLRREGAVAPSTAAALGTQVAAALAAAHALGITHRDVKPANILMTATGTAKLADFGIARGASDPTLTGTGTVIGTIAYMAPEVARGTEAGPASDIWSLGAVLFACTEGTPPFGADTTMAILSRMATSAPPRPSHAGPWTDLISAMLDPDPSRRPSATVVAAALRDVPPSPAQTLRQPVSRPMPAAPNPTQRLVPLVLDRPSVGPKLRRPPAGPSAPRRRRRTIGVVLTVVVLAAAVTSAVALLGHRNQPTGSAGTTASTTPSATAPASPAKSTPATSTHPVGSTTPAHPVDAAFTGAAMTTFVQDYYALLPGNLPAGWPKLGPSMQAQGYASYVDWWSRFDSVSVTVTSADPAAGTVAIQLSEHNASTGQTASDNEVLSLIPSADGSGMLINADAVG